MTLRGKFNLIAASIVLPSVIAVASYFFFSQSDSSDPKQIAVDAGTRRWVAGMLSGKEEDFGELSPGITALAAWRLDGVVVFSNARGLSKGENASFGRLIERVAAAYPGADYVVESVKPDGGYVAVIRPAEGPWYLDPYVIGSGIILALEFLVVIVGIILMVRTSSSLLALGEAVKRIAKGDLAFTIKGRGNDEVTMLYRAFDDMRRELAESQDGRSRFLMGVSHDLRTPLTSLKGYLQALEEGMAKDSATREKFLGILRAKAELLESRIQELIEFASLETASWRAKLVDLRLRDFLEDMASAAISDAEMTDRKFSSRISVDPGLLIKADPRLFEHILENLLSNAIRYTKPGDALHLEAEEDEARVRITVGDNGSGILDGDRKHVFEAFYRGTSARNEEGLGLGLSIVKSVVQAHGWKVFLSEENEIGASFVIEIPKPPSR